MSEIKGTLLSIILAISVFSVLFVVITYSMKNAADSVANELQETTTKEPDGDLTAKPDLLF